MNEMTETQKKRRLKTLLARIEDVKNRRTFFYKSFAGNNVCDKCAYRLAWRDRCRRFNCSIEKVNQRNGGFHHIPCEKCLNYRVTKMDILHLQNLAIMACS